MPAVTPRLRFPLYPLLFAIYPILYLWGVNRSQQAAYVIWRPLLITLAAAALLYLLAGLLLRDAPRAAFATFLISLYLLTYGHLVSFLVSRNIRVSFLLMPFGLLLLALLTAWLVRRYRFREAGKILNPVSALLLLAVTFPTASFYLSQARHSTPPPLAAAPAAANPAHPDVYFIIMDGYSRADLFQSRFHFDNSDFLEALKQRRFVIPACAQSNYPSTTPSIAATLNMNYLDALPQISQAEALTEKGSEKLWSSVQDNAVFRQFRALGYKLASFRGFLPLIDLQNVDLYVDAEKEMSFAHRIETANFESLYLHTTAFYKYQTVVAHLREIAPASLQKYFPNEARFEQVYQQNLYAIQALKDMPGLVAGPRLVYAHLYASHWPYVMLPDGSPRLPFTEAETDEGYLDGVRYLNLHMLDVIDSILQNSQTPPVIILQSDHGYPESAGKPDWSGEDRLKNFSAYYLPGGGDALLYDRITPVNNFRLVLNYYFGANLDLLPDVSYYVDPLDGGVRTSVEACGAGQ